MDSYIAQKISKRMQHGEWKQRFFENKHDEYKIYEKFWEDETLMNNLVRTIQHRNWNETLCHIKNFW